jgi:hypothetical protein
MHSESSPAGGSIKFQALFFSSISS